MDFSKRKNITFGHSGSGNHIKCALHMSDILWMKNECHVPHASFRADGFANMVDLEGVCVKVWDVE